MKRALMLLAAALLFAFGSRVRAETINYEKAIPADSLVFFCTGNIPEIRQQFEKSTFNQLWQEEEVQRCINTFSERLRNKMKKESGPGTPELPTFEEVKSLANGQVVFALTGLIRIEKAPPASLPAADQAQGEPQEESGMAASKPAGKPIVSWLPKLALLMDVGSKRPEAEALIKRLSGPEEPTKARIQTERYKDVEISFSVSEGQDKMIVSWAFMDTTFVAAAAPSLAECMYKLIDAIKEPRSLSSIADDPAYQRFSGKLGKSPVAKVYINMREIAGYIQKADAGGTPGSKIYDLLGLQGLKGLIFGASIEDNAIRTAGFMEAPVAERKGLFKLFASAPKPFATLNLVPANAIGYSGLQLDVAAFYADIMSSLQAGFPEYYPMIQGSIGMYEQMYQLSIANDVLASLGSELAFGTVPVAAESAVVLFAEVKQSEGIQKLINAVNAPSPQAQEGESKPRFETIDFGGYKLYVIPAATPPPMPPAQPGQPAPAPAPPVPAAFCLTDKYFVFSTSVDLLKTTLNRMKAPGEGIGSSPEFKKVMEAAGFTGSGYLMMSFSDVKKSIDQILSPQAKMHMKIAMAMSGKASEWFDPDLLPSAETVKKYLNASASVISASDEGFMFQGYVY